MCDASAACVRAWSSVFSGVYEPAKWRMELKCEAWSRALGVLAETPTASFKIANAASKKLQVLAIVGS